MGSKRKVCIVTGTRAEYGLLYWLMKGIEAETNLELQLIVTGMHLSPEFGLTYTQIENDGFKIDFKVEMLLSSDTSVGITKSMGISLLGFAEALDQLTPDIVVILGDRFEAFTAAAAAMNFRIPIAHLHGGELTEGSLDEPMRHSITKMSSFHFTSTESYRKRVIQLGENPDAVFNVGAIGVENIHKLPLLSRTELEKDLDFEFGEKSLLVTYHPETLEPETTREQFKILLDSLNKLPGTRLLFTKANADTGGRIINSLLDDFAAKQPEKAKVFTSLGQIRYLSALNCVNGVVGNSSSGIIEAPSFKIGTVDIGDRQAGRTRAKSVIHTAGDSDSLDKALNELFSDTFYSNLKNVVNPYDGGNVTKKILNIIKHHRLDSIVKKKFYDLPNIN